MDRGFALSLICVVVLGVGFLPLTDQVPADVFFHAIDKPVEQQLPGHGLDLFLPFIKQPSLGVYSDTITGHVSHTLQGVALPLEGATVTVSGCAGGPVTSDSTGYFEVLVSGSGGEEIYACEVVVSKTGYYDSRTYLIDVPVGGYTLSVHLDETTPPTITFLGPAPSSSVWYNDSFSVSWACSDNDSGVVRDTVSVRVNEPGAEIYVTGTCEDRSDNTAYDTRGPYNLDRTDPEISDPHFTPDTAEDGWANTNVTVTWDCSDDLSGVVASTVTHLFNSEGVDQSATGICTDLAGNTSDDITVYVSIDKTAPTNVTITPDGLLGTNDWYVSDVTLATSSDPDLGTVTCSPPRLLNTDTMGTRFIGSCTNAAGLTSFTSLEVKRDVTPPFIFLKSISGPTGLNDWFIGSVMVRWDCMDQMSRALQSPVTQVISTEGTSLRATGTCTDRAGNTESDGVNIGGIDLTPPAVILVPSGPLGSDGWYLGDITITTTGVDAVSGIDTCSPDQFLLVDTPGQTFSGTCSDMAGRSASGDLTVKRDSTPPVITFIKSVPPPGPSGNYSGPVRFSWSCSDTLSGVTTSFVQQALTSPGRGQSVIGSCVDKAGNVSTDTRNGINIIPNPLPTVPTPTSTRGAIFVPLITPTPTPTATLTPATMPATTSTSLVSATPGGTATLMSSPPTVTVQVPLPDEEQASSPGSRTGLIYAGAGLAGLAVLVLIIWLVMILIKRSRRHA